MKPSKIAQVTLEYVFIAMFVIMGIIVMGPYVIRSVNAYFKSIEEAARDSYTEEFEQAVEPSDLLPDCSCEEDENPTIACDYNVYCPPGYSAYKRHCSPIGCRTPIYCSNNQTACCTDSDWTDTGLCGDYAAPHGTRAGGGCLPNEELQMQECHSDDDIGINFYRYQCVQTPDCSSNCQDISAFAEDLKNLTKMRWCPGDNVLAPPNTPVSVVDTCSATKCELECLSNFVRDGGCVCDEDEGYTEKDLIGSDCGRNQDNCCPKGYIPMPFFCEEDGTLQASFEVRVDDAVVIYKSGPSSTTKGDELLRYGWGANQHPESIAATFNLPAGQTTYYILAEFYDMGDSASLNIRQITGSIEKCFTSISPAVTQGQIEPGVYPHYGVPESSCWITNLPGSSVLGEMQNTVTLHMKIEGVTTPTGITCSPTDGGCPDGYIAEDLSPDDNCTPGSTKPCDCPTGGGKGRETCTTDQKWSTVCEGCYQICTPGTVRPCPPCSNEHPAQMVCQPDGTYSACWDMVLNAPCPP